MSDHTMDQIRGANPFPIELPAPPIEEVWRRLESDPGPGRWDGHAGSPGGRRAPLLLSGASGVGIVLAAVTALAVVVLAVVLLGHARTSTEHSAAGQPSQAAIRRSSTRALVAELGILRQPQTAAARLFNRSPTVTRASAMAPPHRLIASLTRVVSLPDGGRLFLYVAPRAPIGPPVYGLGYHEAYPGSSGGGCCNTAGTLRRPQGPGPDQFESGRDRHTMYFEVVPDGVARVHWVFPRQPIEPSGVPSSLTPVFATPLSVNVVVHDNVAAAKLPQRGLATIDTWYAADGHVIATYESDYSIIDDCVAHGRLTHSYTKSQLRDALSVMPADVMQYTNCSNVIRLALGQQVRSKSSNSGQTNSPAG